MDEPLFPLMIYGMHIPLVTEVVEKILSRFPQHFYEKKIRPKFADNKKNTRDRNIATDIRLHHIDLITNDNRYSVMNPVLSFKTVEKQTIKMINNNCNVFPLQIYVTHHISSVRKNNKVIVTTNTDNQQIEFYATVDVPVDKEFNSLSNCDFEPCMTMINNSLNL